MQQATLNQLNKDNAFKFYKLFVGHVSSNFFAYMFLFLSFYLFAQNYRIAINNDVSLPGKVFLVHYGKKPDVNGLVVFKQDAKYLPKYLTLVKILIGKPGDTISVKNDDVYVNGTYIGHAKKTTKKGKPLTVTDETIVPPGKYFVAGTHKDSFDSRYKEFGFLDPATIEGTAYAIF